MMHRAHSEFGLRTLLRTFAGALAVMTITSCSQGDAFGGESLTSIRFVTQPVSQTAGAPFTVSVELLTTGDVRATSSRAPVTITIVGGGTISGPTTVVAAAGLATFTGISLDSAATGLVLNAARGALAAQSTAFDITAGPPAQSASTLAFTGQVNPAIPVTATLTVKDALGNVIPDSAVTLTTTVASSTFTPSSGTTDTAGTFASSVNFGVAGAGTLTATVGGVVLTFPVDPEVCTIGDITIGTPLAGTVSAAATNGCRLHSHPSGVYRFASPAGPNATMVALSATGTGTFFPELTITPDPRTTTGTVFYDNPSSSLGAGPYEWLLPGDGSFLAHISSANGLGGSFSMTVANKGLGDAGCFTPGNPAQIFRFLPAVNATYGGQTLVTSDCAIADNAQIFYTDFFFLYDNRPCTISMTAAFGVYIQADADDDAGTNIDFVDTSDTTASLSLASCQQNGFPLVISFSSHNPVITGAYSFQFAFTGAALRAGSLVSPVPKALRAPVRARGRASVRK